MKRLVYFMITIFTSQLATAQKVFDKEFPAENNRQVVISNFAGPIEVSQSEGEKISVQVVLEEGTLDPTFSIDYKQEQNYLLIYLRTPCTKAENLLDFDSTNPAQSKYWKDDCSWNLHEREDFPLLSFEVQLPSGQDLYATTILDGDIVVEDASGKLWASNVNGGIALNEVSSVLAAKTVNGNIDIQYKSRPMNDAEFHTINGDIKISLPTESNLTTSFKSFQGRFYTNFESVQLLPRQMMKHNKDKGFKYRLDNRKHVQINAGGTMISIETFNGDAYVTHTQ